MSEGESTSPPSREKPLSFSDTEDSNSPLLLGHTQQRHRSPQTPQPSLHPGASPGLGPVAIPESSAGDQAADAKPKHWSLFYEREGISALQPLSIHYLHLGCWATRQCDYYFHRRPAGTERSGQTVVWLHNARPRDRFVFLISDVYEPGTTTVFSMLWQFVYGQLPAFATPDRDVVDVIRRKGNKSRARRGFQSVEVEHREMTAADYAPSLTTTRLALETRKATCRWFDTKEAALAYYDFPEELSAAALERLGTIGGGIGSVGDQTHATESITNGSFGGIKPFRLADDGEVSGLDSRKGSPNLRPTTPSLPSLDPLTLPPAAVTEGGPSSLGSTLHSRPASRPVTPMPPPSSQHDMSTPSASAQARTATPLPPPTPGLGPIQYRPVPKEGITTEHLNTMVIVYVQDPHFNAALREVLIPEPGNHPYTLTQEDQKRLLALYETGMPSWTIFFCRWGLPYRRWFRLVAVGIVNTWPLIALCVGLYDLYKNLPYVNEWLAEYLHPLQTWLEGHFTARIGILVTYITTVSLTALASAHGVIKSIIAVLQFVLSPLYPLLSILMVLRYPVMMLWTGLLSPIINVGWLGIWTTVSAPFRVVAYILGSLSGAQQVKSGVQNAGMFVVYWRSWMEFWDKVARPVKNLMKACYDGIVHLGVAIARREASLRRWYTGKMLMIYNAINRFVTVSLDVLLFNGRAIAQLPFFSIVVIWWTSIAFAMLVTYLRAGGGDELLNYGCEQLTGFEWLGSLSLCDRPSFVDA